MIEDFKNSGLGAKAPDTPPSALYDVPTAAALRKVVTACRRATSFLEGESPIDTATVTGDQKAVNVKSNDHVVPGTIHLNW